MAKRDVYKYYNQCTDQIVELKESLNNLKKTCGTDKLADDKMEYLTNLVNLMRENCDRLGYIMYLLKLPYFDFKKEAYNLKTKGMVEYFKSKKADKESMLKHSNDILEEINKYIENIEKETADGNTTGE